MSILNYIWHYTGVVFYILSVLCVVGVVVSENRNPVKSLAWILVLLFIPILGFILYMFFGQDLTRQRLISKKQFRRIILSGNGSTEANSQVETPYAQLSKMLNQINPLSTLSAKNEVRILTTGQEKFDLLFKAIKEAKNHIHIQYYIFADDKIGNQLKMLLIEKAQQGVEVRLLIDDVGCWNVKRSFFQEMEDHGVIFQSFLRVKFRKITGKVNYRNHRKIVVIDGSIGFVGGMNVADRYVDGPGWGDWQDAHLMIRGEAVYSLQSSFLIDWHYAQKSLPELEKYFPSIEPSGNVLMQIATDGPFGKSSPIQQALVKSILTAKEYIYLQTPYFLPTESIMMALKTAAQSGVDVRLMIPEHSDVKFVHWGTLSYVKQMLESGVKVYLYQGGFQHAKTFVSDDYVSSVGSANVDFRSFEHNFEINTYLYNRDIAKEMYKLFINNQKRSLRVTTTMWQHRPISRKVLCGVARVFSPIF